MTLLSLPLNDFQSSNNIHDDIGRFQHFANENLPHVLTQEHYQQIRDYINNTNNKKTIIHLLYYCDSKYIHNYRINNINNVYNENSYLQLNQYLFSYTLLNQEEFQEYYDLIKSYGMNFPSEQAYALQCTRQEIYLNNN